MTFVSPDEGWVLGSVGGKLAMSRTTDGGRTWAGSGVPPTHLSRGTDPGGVLNVRFANPRDGWVFDPELWATHDGGDTWSRVELPGSSSNAIVLGLETAGGLVHAAANDGSAYLRIATSPVSVDAWRLSSTELTLGAGPVPSPKIVLQGTTGWIIEVDRTVIAGAQLVAGQWVTWRPPCTDALGPASLAASSPEHLVAVCDVGVWGPAPTTIGDHSYTSDDAGATFTATSTQPPTSEPGVISVGSPSPGIAVAASGAAMVGTFDGGQSWQVVYKPAQHDFVSYVGFETATQGVAIAEDYSDAGVLGPYGTLLMTHDGGRNWSPLVV